MATIQKLDVSAVKTVVIQSESDGLLSVALTGTNAADVPMMLAAGLARAYDTFPAEQKAKLDFATYLSLLNKSALEYHTLIENSK